MTTPPEEIAGLEPVKKKKKGKQEGGIFQTEIIVSDEDEDGEAAANGAGNESFVPYANIDSGR